MAGLWFEVLTAAERKSPEKARALFPEIIDRDEKIKTELETEAFMKEAKAKLQTVRDDFDMKGSCQK